MRAALLIAGKDLRQRLRDRSALLGSIVVPLVLASIFGLIFHNAIGGRLTFKLGLVDQDRGPAAQAFVTEALARLGRTGLIPVRREPTLSAARSATEQSKVSATFVLPAGLSAAIGHGHPSTLPVLRNEGTTTGPAQIAAIPSPISIADSSTKSRQLDAGTFYAAGMAVFFLFFTVQFGISSILEERRDGTLARMLVAPI